MIALTAPSRIDSSSCSRRTTSRSLTMPSTACPSALTTTAPTLCSASSRSSSRTVASGGMVMTSALGLLASTSLIRMTTSSGIVSAPLRLVLSALSSREQVVDRPSGARRFVGVVIAVGEGSQERQRGVVQVPVRGERVASERTVVAGERGEQHARLANDHVEGRHVVYRQLGF